MPQMDHGLRDHETSSRHLHPQQHYRQHAQDDFIRAQALGLLEIEGCLEAVSPADQ